MEQKTSEFDKVLGAWDILVIAFGAMIGWGWVCLLYTSVSSSLTVAIVIRDTVGSSVVPAVRLIYHEICKWLSEFLSLIHI